MIGVQGGQPPWRGVAGGSALRAAASPRVQAWFARAPGLRWIARSQAESLMDLVAGFVHSQVLLALAELRVLERVVEAPAPTEALARGVPAERMETLLKAAAALGLVRRGRGGWRATIRGAALVGAPGAMAMIRHHGALYADLADPVGLLRGRDTALGEVWPYARRAPDGGAAARYSELMALTQAPVAAATLRAARLGRARGLLDVGGGTGAFAVAAARRHPRLKVTVLDLPAVEGPAREAIARAGLGDRVRFEAGDFREGLPGGFEAITLVRVLYDHDDATVGRLLSSARAALRPGGRVVVSEPMSGGARPRRITDGYFALYCLAMGGRVRSADEVAGLMRAAGLGRVRERRTGAPHVTGVVEGEAVQRD